MTNILSACTLHVSISSEHRKRWYAERPHLKVFSQNDFLFLFVVDTRMRAWAKINFHFFRSVCNHEIDRRLTTPVLQTIVPTLGFAAGACKKDATTSYGYLSTHHGNIVYVKERCDPTKPKVHRSFFSRSELARLSFQNLPREASWSMIILILQKRDLHGPSRRHRSSHL